MNIPMKHDLRNMACGLLLFSFALLPCGARGQWVQTNGPYGGDIYSFAVNGKNLFVGTGGGVYVTTDNGANWIHLNNGLGATPGATLLATADTSLIAACPGDGGIYLSTNNGMDWKPPTRYYAGVHALAFSGAYLLVGTDYGISRTSDNGTNWEDIRSLSPGGRSRSVFTIAVSGNKIFAGTDTGIYFSTDYGSHWVFDTNANGGYSFAVSGNDIFSGGYRYVYHSSDNGTNWVASDSSLKKTGEVRALVLNGTYLFAGTDSGVYLSTNKGISWSLASNGLPKIGIYALAAVGTNIFAGTNYNSRAGLGVYVSNDSGAHWQPASNGLEYFGITSFTASGQNLFAGTSQWGVYRSTDNGNNWLPMNDSIGYFPISSLATNDTDIFAASTYNIFISSNYGISWSSVKSGLIMGYGYGPIYLLSFKNNIIARENVTTYDPIDDIDLTYGYIFISTDHGAIWNSIDNGLTIDKGTGGEVYAVAFCNGELFAGTYSGVYTSTNDGESWNSSNDGLSYNGVHVFSSAGTNIYAGAFDSIFRSTNNGKNWMPVTTVLTGVDLTVGPLVAVGMDLFAGVGRYAGAGLGIFFSTDNGTTWSSENEGLLNLNISCLFAKGAYLYAGTDSGVWRRPLADFGLSPVHEEPSTLPRNTALQNYPNPFSSTTTISFDAENISSMKIYDALGREVADFTSRLRRLSPLGSGTVEFDARNLPAGVYYYQMVAGQELRTGMMNVVH